MREPGGLRHVEHVMGTVFSFDIRDRPTPELQRGLAAAISWLHRVDQVFSTYRPDSQISRPEDLMPSTPEPPDSGLPGTSCTGSEEEEVNVMGTKQWDVQIHIVESGKDTHVRAVLTTMAGTTFEGGGHARRHPRDRAVPEIGDELAAGRALIDLGSRLVQLATAEIAKSVSASERSWRR